MDAEKTISILALSIWFNVAWAACVFGPDWAALVSFAVWLVIALSFDAPISLIVPVALAGLVMDGLLVLTGVYQFTGIGIPIWLVVLWFGFSVYLVVLRKKLGQVGQFWFVAVLALFAPVCYWVGVASGKLIWPLGGIITYILSAAGWFIYSAAIHLVLTWPKGQSQSITLKTAGKSNEE